jgi:hypothetical protein
MASLSTIRITPPPCRCRTTAATTPLHQPSPPSRANGLSAATTGTHSRTLRTSTIHSPCPMNISTTSPLVSDTVHGSRKAGCARVLARWSNNRSQNIIYPHDFRNHIFSSLTLCYRAAALNPPECIVYQVWTSSLFSLYSLYSQLLSSMWKDCM